MTEYESRIVTTAGSRDLERGSTIDNGISLKINTLAAHLGFVSPFPQSGSAQTISIIEGVDAERNNVIEIATSQGDGILYTVFVYVRDVAEKTGTPWMMNQYNSQGGQAKPDFTVIPAPFLMPRGVDILRQLGDLIHLGV